MVATVDIWVLSILLVLMMPPCGFISLLCLMLARRSCSAGSTSSSDITATYLEHVACSTVVTALCSLLAINFYTDEFFRNHIIRYLVSSNCFYGGTNSTVLPRKLSFLPHLRYLKNKCAKALKLLRVVAHTS